jgi:hypothetical protein
MPLTSALVQRLADRVAGLRGRPAQHVPDLGPAAVMDQLTVMVYDLFATQPDAKVSDVVSELSGIRQQL